MVLRMVRASPAAGSLVGTVSYGLPFGVRCGETTMGAALTPPEVNLPKIGVSQLPSVGVHVQSRAASAGGRRCLTVVLGWFVKSGTDSAEKVGESREGHDGKSPLRKIKFGCQ